MVFRSLILLLIVSVELSCSSMKKNKMSNSVDISELVKYCDGTLELDKEKTYYIDKSIMLPSDFTLEGNGALIKVKPQREKIHSAFLISGDNITVKNINIESNNIYSMVAHRDKTIVNPLSSNIYAFVSKNTQSNFKLLNCNFNNITRILKLSRMKGLLVDNVKCDNCQSPIYCQFCSDVELRRLDFSINNTTNKFTHHLYFNSVNNLSIINSKFSKGVGKAINIKVDDTNHPSSKVRISDVQLDSTGGIFLTYVDDVEIVRLTSFGTKRLLICSSNVGDVKILNSEIYSLDESGPTISALDNSSPVKRLSVAKSDFHGPINIEGHSIEKFIIDSCKFVNFFFDKLVRNQNVFYMKRGKYQGEFVIKNCRFEQNYKNEKSVFIKNETNKSFYFLDNYVKFKFPHKDLIRSGNNALSHLKNNKISGVKNISNNMKSIKSIE